MEGNLVAGLGRVRSIPSPLQGELVRRVEQDGVLNGVPEADVLANLVDAESALDVASPSVGIEPLRNGPRLPLTRGDAGKEPWCYLADRSVADPAIVLEEGREAIPQGHRGAGEEQGAFIRRELQVEPTPCSVLVGAAKP